MDLDSRGIPGGFVASSEFVEAAAAQGNALGFNAAAVYVPHPIQDRTDEEVVELADNAIDAILAMVCTDP